MKLSSINFSQKAVTLFVIALLYFAALPNQAAFAQNNIVYEEVDKMPVPHGGMEGLMSYLGQNIKYPKAAKKKGIEGKVFVDFVVKEDGSISDVSILRGIGGGCDEEAFRVVSDSPQWTPGEIDGKRVSTRMKLPIEFKL
ncbi:energy transducer TonB [uncultured Algoriphagus sp.]|uniref:energy transducer TonB n=1 Tax=uncultured Algoriphagus sp. TaxID=417365 RepID=UPI0030EBF216|tara:strand:- start:33167 stop:33586 length:420 start_codon:yes stop_codon:yes gene_type:complete